MSRLGDPATLDDVLLYRLQSRAEVMVAQAERPKADRRRGSRPRRVMG